MVCVLVSLLIFAGGCMFQSPSGYNSTNPSPTRTPFNPGIENASTYTSISVGYQHIIALRTDGTITTWGQTVIPDWSG